MSRETRKELETNIANAIKALDGETVNGVKLGDAGITRQFLEGVIRNSRRILNGESVLQDREPCIVWPMAAVAN